MSKPLGPGITLVIPVPQGTYRITDDFDAHKNRGDFIGNGGIDYGCPLGTPVSAAATGTVIETGYDADGYGNYIKIAHRDDYLTLYGHLSEISAEVFTGAVVKIGQRIGRVGSTGKSSGPHLHFEARWNNHDFDPAEFMAESAPPEYVEPLVEDFNIPANLLPGARCKVQGLRVRVGPGTNYRTTGVSLSINETVEVMETALVGDDVWCKIGHNAWCAGLYKGQRYLRGIPQEEQVG